MPSFTKIASRILLIVLGVCIGVFILIGIFAFLFFSIAGMAGPHPSLLNALGTAWVLSFAFPLILAGIFGSALYFHSRGKYATSIGIIPAMLAVVIAIDVLGLG